MKRRLSHPYELAYPLTSFNISPQQPPCTPQIQAKMMRKRMAKLATLAVNRADQRGCTEPSTEKETATVPCPYHGP